MHSVREYLATFSAAEMADRIRHFRTLNFRRLTKEEVHQSIRNVLLGGNPLLAMPTQIRTYPVGSDFFRLRRPNKPSSAVPMDCAITEADAWEPPTEFARASRLNVDGEPLLYTSPASVILPMEEAKLANGEHAAMFVYRAKQPVKVNVIGDRFDGELLSEDERYKLSQISDFLHDEFTRDVGAGTEHLYRLSETIAKDWYDLPPGVIQDAWCYPSVASKGGFNVCFRPDLAHECLRLRGALVGTRTGDNFAVKLVAIVNDGAFSYHRLGSDIHKQVFPEVVTGE